MQRTFEEVDEEIDTVSESGERKKVFSVQTYIEVEYLSEGKQRIRGTKRYATADGRNVLPMDGMLFEGPNGEILRREEPHFED